MMRQFTVMRQFTLCDSLPRVAGGVGNWTLVLSWYLAYGMVYAVLSLCMTVASVLGLFGTTDVVLLFLFYFLSLMSIMAHSFFFHTFFNKAKTGGIIGAILFVSCFMIWAGIKTQSSGVKSILGILHPGIAFCFAVRHFA